MDFDAIIIYFSAGTGKKRPVKLAYAVFSLGKFGIWATVVLSFLFGN